MTFNPSQISSAPAKATAGQKISFPVKQWDDQCTYHELTIQRSGVNASLLTFAFSGSLSTAEALLPL